jgi:hypothetical protein
MASGYQQAADRLADAAAGAGNEHGAFIFSCRHIVSPVLAADYSNRRFARGKFEADPSRQERLFEDPIPGE